MANHANSAQNERSAVVVFYKTDNGNIAHVHHCEADAGSELPAREALEKQAWEHAERHVHKGMSFEPKELNILHVDSSTFRMDRLYKVDTTNRRLVEIPKHKS
jgi:hypothetical protein